MKTNQITFKVAKLDDPTAKAIGIAVSTDGAVAKELGMSRDQLTALGFDGKVGQTLLLPTSKTKLTIAVGIGEAAKANADVLRNVAAALARASAKVSSLSTSLATAGRGDRTAIAQAVTEGLILATHRYDALKSDKKATSKLTSVTLVAPGAVTTAVTNGAKRGETIADAVCLARDLANMPPAHLTAKMFAERAQKVGAEAGVKVEVFNKDQLLAMGCGGIIGVNRGSVNPPRMVKISYRPSGARSAAKKSAKKSATKTKLPHLILVGKGVMYDSGGISLKPSNSDHAMMKADMTGAAAVLATMGTLKALGCKSQVTAYMMCTDNLPSGSAMAMGDVLTMRNGKTVEIHNTDAEGRLVLADGLSLAVEQKPDAIVDIATLTGACQRALGPQMSGVFGNDQRIVKQVVAAAAATDEQTWQLPLERKYRPAIDSYIADMKNVGGEAGAITAALFLDEFTSGLPWAHIDIAGPMWSDSDAGWLQRGATAYGTRLLINLSENFKRR